MEKLIRRNAKERLGAGPGDAEDIKKHPFFAGIDWVKLYNKELTPPFRPEVVRHPPVLLFLKVESFSLLWPQRGPGDTTNFDAPTISQEELASLGLPQELIPEKDQEKFRGFTYAAPEDG